MRPYRIAIVVQRYGENVLGGSEDAARALAEHLTALAEVHVLTTCAIEYTTWANIYPPGDSQLNGVIVHRFPVDWPRDWQKAVQSTGRFWQQTPPLEEQLEWIQQNGPFSTALLRYIHQSEAAFDTFIFITYLYATTYFGLPLVAHKAILAPTAHDERFLYALAYRILFHLPRHLVYLTEAEREIVHQVTGNNHIPDTVAAIGLSAPTDISAGRFRQKYGVEGDFLLYGGRISHSKNVPELIDFFRQYRQEHGRQLKLVLMGAGDYPIPQHPDIMPIGFVTEQDKFDALKAATLVIQPSLFESLSLIILQAWLVGTAVLVHGNCAVTKQQCRRSNGGLYYHAYAEFTAVINTLLNSPHIRTQLGRQGCHFVTTNYNWDVIIKQYQAIFNEMAGECV